MLLARLWLHEVNRVYGDRLVNEQDTGRFDEMVSRVGKNFFEDLDADKFNSLPLAFTTFAMGASTDEKVYFSIDTYDKLKRIIKGKLDEYNDANARMDLVRFEQAMSAFSLSSLCLLGFLCVRWAQYAGGHDACACEPAPCPRRGAVSAEACFVRHVAVTVMWLTNFAVLLTAEASLDDFTLQAPPRCWRALRKKAFV